MDLQEAFHHAERVATEILRAEAEVVDRDAVWPEAGIRALQKAGLGGLVVPRSSGGHGHGLVAVARICEILGRECASTGISFGMHLVGSAVLSAKATTVQKQRYLDAIVRGEHLTTLALSEPGTGSQFYIPEAALERTEHGFTVSGTKSFVTNGGFADSYVVSAAAVGEHAGPGEFSCVVVPAQAPGLSWGPHWAGWGMRGNSARELQLSSTPIGRDDLLGSEGDEIWFVFQVITPYFLMAMAGTYVGVIAAALEQAREHLGRRSHSHTGVPVAHNTIVQHELGRLWGALQRARALVHDAARMGDEGDPEALPALCSAKAEVAETADQVTAGAMTLMGGRGYAEGHRIHHLYRDARAAHVMAPTTQQLRTWTGRALLGVPLLADG